MEPAVRRRSNGRIIASSSGSQSLQDLGLTEMTEDRGVAEDDEAVMAERVLAGQSIPVGHSAKLGPKHEEAVHPVRLGNGKPPSDAKRGRPDWFVFCYGKL